jgi:hypothetical protein
MNTGGPGKSEPVPLCSEMLVFMDLHAFGAPIRVGPLLRSNRNDEG